MDINVIENTYNKIIKTSSAYKMSEELENLLKSYANFSDLDITFINTLINGKVKEKFYKRLDSILTPRIREKLNKALHKTGMNQVQRILTLEIVFSHLTGKSIYDFLEQLYIDEIRKQIKLLKNTILISGIVKTEMNNQDRQLLSLYLEQGRIAKLIEILNKYVRTDNPTK